MPSKLLPSPAKLLSMARARGYGKSKVVSRRGKFRFRKRQLPARFRANRRKYYRNRSVLKTIRNIAETKLIQINDQNLTLPHATANSGVYYQSFVLGPKPSSWTDSNMVALGGTTIAPGLTPQNRVGKSVFFRQTIIKMQIEMDFVNTGYPPINFRLLVVKPRGYAIPAGKTDLPSTTLFMSQLGNNVGYLTTGTDAMSSFEYATNLLNKRDWIVYRDQKFTLSHPMRSDSDGGYVGYSGKYKIQKFFNIKLPHWKKTRMTTTDNLPEDFDASYLILVFAESAKGTTSSFLPYNWCINMRGTTSFTDL